MTDYTVDFTTAAAREIRKLERAIRVRVLNEIAALKHDPRPDGCRKLAGEKHAWRIRVGDYRVHYEIADNTVTVTVFRVAHRRDVYR